MSAKIEDFNIFFAELYTVTADRKSNNYQTQVLIISRKLLQDLMNI